MRVASVSSRSCPVVVLWLLLCSLLVAGGAAQAAQLTFNINANGANEVNAAGVPNQGDPDGTAVGTLILNNGTGAGTTGSATFNLTLANLDVPLTGFHIHSAVSTTTGPVFIDFGNPEAFRTGNTLAGVVSNLSAVNVTTVLNTPSNFYLNMHNGAFPAGAVRDQLETGSSTVNTTQDHDDGVCDAADCTLREAITIANSINGADTIGFNIATPGKTIIALTPLPDINDTVTIDGSTQPGFAGAPLIELTAGAGAKPPNAFGPGLRIVGDDCIIRGLVINGFASGIGINGGGGNLLAERNHIEGCYIGTNLNGVAQAGLGNGNGIGLSDDGFTPGTGAVNNVIGGTTAASRNVISNNLDYGVALGGGSTSGNLIQGNYIGVDATGNAAAPNGRFGVAVFAAGNTIGGTTPGERNVISGNPEIGVWLPGNSSTGNVVQGNYIGTNAAGTAGIPNGTGVVLSDNSSDPLTGAHDNIVGGLAAGAGNLISGNAGDGVAIQGVNVRNNSVLGNFIGTNFDGSAALPNIDEGVVVNGPDNVIGGTVAGARNIISGNFFNGIDLLPNATGTVIEGNFIGTNVNGNAGIGNGGAGVQVNGGSYNTIGGSSPGAGNTIAANLAFGVVIIGPQSVGNVVHGNTIGAQDGGLIPLGNGVGVSIVSASDNTIGGSGAGEGNVISGNPGAGVSITLADPGDTAAGNIVWGNRIGLDAIGDNMANGSSGVFLGGLVTGNTIGGTSAGARNFISGNLGDGVDILGDGNTVQGNFIGTNLTGLAAGANGLAGVSVSGSDNVIGGDVAGAGNTIAFNNNEGIAVTGSGVGNAIHRNSIFGNGSIGIDLNSDGATPNDAGDGDTGPNNRQNFPVLIRALRFNTQNRIAGTFNSTANSTFRLEFFSNPAGGAPDGRTFLGSTNVTTDGSGNASFEFSVSASVPVGDDVTATATDAAGNTSEFSSPIPVTLSQSIAGYVRTNALVPIPGASITINPVPGGVVSPAVSDDSGFFLFADVPNGNYTLTITKAGWSFSPPAISLRVNGASRGANFLGTPVPLVFDISGRISNGLGGVPNIPVSISPAQDGVPSQTMTNSAGYYAFRDLLAGTYTVAPVVQNIAVNPASRQVTIVDLDMPGQNFTLGVRVSGRVVDGAGAAMPGVDVTLDPFGPALTGVQNPVTTNQAGYYSFYGVPQGRFSIVPAEAGFSFTPSARQIDVGSSDLSGQNFTGSSGFSISGRIATSGGVGIAGVVVQLDGGPTTTTNTAGYYTLNNVANGLHTLTPSKAGLTFTPTNRTVVVDNTNVANQHFVGG